MASNRSVFNTSRGYYLKEKYAQKGIQNGAFVWDESRPGCVRDATLAEKYEALVADAAKRERNAEPLSRAELAGIVYRPAAGKELQHRESKRVAYQAREWVASAI